ncbi:AMP-binding protein [Humidisolicoccus flavus]|uniref:AMP-binding protein n=1 Tax=Humidisolicoccus flavus TaxID=3111414 RepID=UPI00324AC125
MTLFTIAPSTVRSLSKSVSRHGVTLTALARAAAKRFGDRTAYIAPSLSDSDAARQGDSDNRPVHWSYKELWNRAEALALGIYLGKLAGPKQLIVVAAEGAALPISIIAAGRLGLDCMPLNPRAYMPEDLIGIVPSTALVIYDGEKPQWHHGPSLSAKEVFDISHCEGSGLGRSARRGRLILLTSAMTGTPTPHVRRTLSVKSLMQLAGLHRSIGIAVSDTVIGFTPLHHGHGLQLFAASLLTGATLISAPHLSAEDRLSLMRSAGATVASGLPQQFEKLVEHLERTGESAPPLRRIVCGSESLSTELAGRVENAWGKVIVNCYGTAETGTVAVAVPELLAKFPGTVGVPLPGVDVGIVGNRGRADGEGRIWIRALGTSVITDDRGRWEDGRLYITGHYNDAGTVLDRPETLHTNS